MAAVKLESINMFYGNTQVLFDIDIDIQDGEFVVLVGPSGCGKSTTLRIIAGLEESRTGEVYIEDKHVTHLPPKERNIAMVFQNYALYPHMTVFDNMAFGLKLRKFKKPERKERVEEAAAILGIEELLERRPKELSGGQRQRVALGRALVRKPTVFLFDEPLSNLDAKLRVQMRTEIKKLHQKLKTTMIYVTHDQTEAMTMGDRIIVMKDGVIMQEDKPLTLYKKPQNSFVAGFIGSPSMNFLEGEVIADGGVKLKGEKFEIKVNEEDAKALKNHLNKKVEIGIRPESLSIISENEAEIFAELEVVELMGNESFVYSKVGEKQLVARVDETNINEEKRTIFYKPSAGSLHLFEIESGNRIN